MIRIQSQETELKFINQKWLSAESYHFQLNKHQKNQGRVPHKDSNTWITLSMNPKLFKANRDIQHARIWEEAQTKSYAQKRKYHKGILHRRHCVSREAGEVNQKGRVIPETSIQKNIPYTVLEKSTPRSYWWQRLHFCEGLGSPGRKGKEAEARMENIPSTMVLHKNVDEADTRFSTMSGPLANNLL